jgi:hypothetical protein
VPFCDAVICSILIGMSPTTTVPHVSRLWTASACQGSILVKKATRLLSRRQRGAHNNPQHIVRSLA